MSFTVVFMEAIATFGGSEILAMEEPHRPGKEWGPVGFPEKQANYPHFPVVVLKP